MTTTIFFAILLLAIVLTILFVFINRKKMKQRGQSNQRGQRRPIDDNNEARIYIGNLHYRIKEKELAAAFESMGSIQEVKIVKNRKTGRSKGFAFIAFADSGEANRALSLNGQVLQGRPLVVKLAKPKEYLTDQQEG